MIKLILILFAFIYTSFAYSEDAKSIETEINELRSPSAPAFTILDINPSSIAKPLSPRELSTSILTAAGDNNSNIPDNLSLEFTPYWWKARPNISFDDYTNEKNIVNRIKRSASFSIGSVSSTESDVTSTELALGVRFNLISGKLPSTATEGVKNASEKLVTIIGDDPACAVDAESDSCKKVYKEAENALNNSIDEFAKNRRTGFQVDIAFALAYDFPSNSTSDSDFSKGGLWMTTSYTPKNSSKGGLQYLGLVRYIDERNESGSNDIFDLGARIVWQHYIQPIAFSFEYINRFKDEGNDSKRYSGIIEYRINEKLNLVASFGKNFKSEESQDDLFVLGGLSFNFGTGPSVALPK